MSSSDTPFYILSLPSSTFSGGDAETILGKNLSNYLIDKESDIQEFRVPSFKIGTLDQLIHHAEDLHKLDGQFEGIVRKISDIIKSLYPNSPSEIEAARKVNDKLPEAYLKTFQWNHVKYRSDRSISELLAVLSKEVFSLDADVKNTYNAYTTAKGNLAAIERKQGGNLSSRSLQNVVSAQDFVLGSEYLQTILVAVPKNQKSEFLKTYETLSNMVVPRSANILATDSDYVLFNVTLFKKFIPDFIHKCREFRWTPREFDYNQEMNENLELEKKNATILKVKTFQDISRLAKTAFSDSFSAWIHLKAVRVFVESVLRYGLPPDFISVLLRIPNNHFQKAKQYLDSTYDYLAGNAFARDKYGKIKDSGLGEYGSLVDTDYEAYVFYKIDV